MDVAEALKQLTPILKTRLRQPDKAVERLATALLSAVLQQTVTAATSGDVTPTSLTTTRVQLLELIVAELGRVPSAGEVVALLKVTDATARSLLKQVLAVSDRARSFALASVFQRASPDGDVGGEHPIAHGKKWRFTTHADLRLAKEELEIAGVAFSTLSSKDGNYVLVVSPKFAP